MNNNNNITKYRPDKDDLCDFLNNLYGFDGIEKSWLHLHVDRIDSNHKGDNFYFHPDGYRFRSKQEIEKWRSLGSDPNQLSLFKCAFVRDPKEYGGLGITKRQAELAGKIQPALMPLPPVLPRQKRKRTDNNNNEDSSSPTDFSSDEDSSNNVHHNTEIISSPLKNPHLSLQLLNDDGNDNESNETFPNVSSSSARANKDQTKSFSSSSLSSSSSSRLPLLPGLPIRSRKHNKAASLCNVYAFKESEMPVISIHQKDQWLGDMRLTHAMGTVNLRNFLPSRIHIHQRTSYFSVYELGTKYFLESLAYAADPKEQNIPAATSYSNETFQGQIMVARLEMVRSIPIHSEKNKNNITSENIVIDNEDTIAASSSSSSSSSSSNIPSVTAPSTVTELSTNSSLITSLVPTGKNLLENMFINLNIKGRVSYCQTICNNNHLFIIPRTYVVPPPPAKPTETVIHPAIVQDYLRYIFNCSEQVQVPTMPRHEDAFLIFVVRNPGGRTLMNTPGLGEDLNGPLRHIQSNPRCKRVGSISARSNPFPPAPTYEEYLKQSHHQGIPVIPE